MSQIARGSFEVELTPQSDTGAVDGNCSIGRMTLNKRFSGDLAGTGEGEMIGARTQTQGSAGYAAVERVTGSLHGREGTFVLLHRGVMYRGAADLSIQVVPDSGTGALVGISGELQINMVEGQHLYEFAYQLPE
jgi:hypothetical protein